MDRMIGLYNALLPLLRVGVRIAGLVNPKIRRGLAGRRALIEEVARYYSTTEIKGVRILLHVASFGELEQAKPVVTALRAVYPDAHIHLTFFSPSGYENAVGKYADVDLITYAPIDARGEVIRFLDLVQPTISLFTRYDVWPNMALELARRHIPSLLFAATADDASGRTSPLVHSLHETVYRSLSRILVISEPDRATFRKFGVADNRLIVAGDTRFDQVLARRERSETDHVLPEKLRSRIAQKGTFVFVVGSAWPADEKVISKSIGLSIERSDNLLTIIVPHEPSTAHVAQLLGEYGVNAIRLSEIERYNREPVIVADSIGKLFTMYRYADLAMVGGGFGAGLHNALEAAAWGAPVIVGPKHHRSTEVGQLIERTAAFEVSNAQEFDFVFWRLVKDDELRTAAGERAGKFVAEHQGATTRIVEEIGKLLLVRNPVGA